MVTVRIIKNNYTEEDLRLLEEERIKKANQFYKIHQFIPQLVSKKFLLKESIPNMNWLRRQNSYSYGIPNLDHASRMCGYLHTRGSHGYNHKKWSNIERRWMRLHKNIMEKI